MLYFHLHSVQCTFYSPFILLACGLFRRVFSSVWGFSVNPSLIDLQFDSIVVKRKILHDFNSFKCVEYCFMDPNIICIDVFSFFSLFFISLLFSLFFYGLNKHILEFVRIILYVHDLSQSIIVVILPVHVTYKNMISLYMALPSPIYNRIIFKISLYTHLEPHQLLWWFFLQLSNKISKTQEEKGNTVLTHIFAYHVIQIVCFLLLNHQVQWFSPLFFQFCCWAYSLNFKSLSYCIFSVLQFPFYSSLYLIFLFWSFVYFTYLKHVHNFHWSILLIADITVLEIILISIFFSVSASVIFSH